MKIPQMGHDETNKRLEEAVDRELARRAEVAIDGVKLAEAIRAGTLTASSISQASLAVLADTVLHLRDVSRSS